MPSSTPESRSTDASRSELLRAHRQPLASSLKTPAWAFGDAPDRDVVLVSRARLACNLADYPFPGRAGERELRLGAQQIRRAARADTARLADLAPVSVASLSPSDRAALLDARRISPELARGGAHRYALLSDDGLLSVFVNEEDHVRVNALSAGSNLWAALESAHDAQTRLSRRLRWAHSPHWGYLTTALTNMGTGLRLSVLLHLPALRYVNRAETALNAARSLGTSVRGAHGEHSEAAGDLYQISNAVTWGYTNEQIAARLRPVIAHLIEAERTARNEVAASHARTGEEAARAAWNVICAAEKLNAAEALGLLSALRLAAAARLPGSLSALGGPDGASLFCALVADLQTATPLSDASVSPAPDDANALRAAIRRAARLRSALRSV